MKFSKYLEEAKSLAAYFISPSGKVIPTKENHIRVIIENPKTFGYTSDEIRKIYDKYNEKVGTEGRAREEIILDLVKKGWIRARRYTNQRWSINTNKLNKRVKNILYRFFQSLLKGIAGFREKDMYMPVVIQDFYGVNMTSTVGDIIKDALFFESTDYDESIIIETFDEIEDYIKYVEKNNKEW
jgi:hypothetical protein